MTTLAELRALVSTDIRDPLNATFKAPQVDNLINQGIVEVGRIYPQEVIDTVVPVASTYTYDTVVEQAFRVEAWRSGKFLSVIPANEDDGSQGGWELFAGSLHFPTRLVDGMVPATDSFNVWGYRGRAQLTDDDQVAELDDQAEWGVRAYARWMAYQSMLAERALFKQFQGISQNTDITPAQLQQDVLIYAQEWSRTRNRLRRLRRI